MRLIKPMYFFVLYNYLDQVMKVATPNPQQSSTSSKAVWTSLQYYFVPVILSIFVILPQKIPSLQLIAFFYGVLPILDKLFSLDLVNPTAEEAKVLQENNFYYELCLYTTIVVEWICLFRILNDVGLRYETLNYLEIVGHLVMYGNIASMGIIISHELYHKEGTFIKTIGLLSMINSLYIHWPVEHAIGHHRHVATPIDPATAPKDVSFYEFYPRTVIGTWKSSYQIEQNRGKPIFLNLAVLSLVANVVTISLIYFFYGAFGALTYIIGGSISFTFLEIVNYLEHYGLLRDKLPNGEYERVNIRHSWNTPHRFTNYFMFKLQRHSDHHENSYKPYQVLLTLDESPNLPQGYTAMVVVALFPSTFFQIMNPLLEYYSDKNKGKVADQALKIKSQKRCDNFMLRVAFYLIGVAVINKVGANYESLLQIL